MKAKTPRNKDVEIVTSSEGRKAAEKERREALKRTITAEFFAQGQILMSDSMDSVELRISDLEVLLQIRKDFQELLEMMTYVVDRIGDSGPFGQMHALEKLRAWKNARGIE